MKKTLSLLLTAAFILSAAVSCSDGTTRNDEVTTAAPETAAAETEVVYPAALSDYGGYTFTFLNQSDSFWSGSYHVLDFEETTGEPINDAVYTRNRAAESDLDIVIEVEKGELGSGLRASMEKAVTSGDDIYDAVYLPLNWANQTSFTGEYVLNLYSISTLNFNEDWWNKSFIDTVTVGGGTLYTTIDYVCMMGYSYCNALFYNKDMAAAYNMADPYELVRDGSWTYDKMNAYIAPVVNLNGDASFKITAGGSCVYGFVGQHAETAMTLLDGCGEFLISKDENDMPVLNASIERISDAYAKLTDTMSRDGWCELLNTAELTGCQMFLDGRAMFYTGALGGSSSGEFRSSETEYGILPLPKYDEEQQDYCTIVSQYTFALNIPLTASDPERTGAIIDYLSFLGWRDVLPVMQESFCYKGARDEDSIEMMNILLDTRTVDFGFIYGWTTNLITGLCDKMLTGSNSFASSYASAKDGIEADIAKAFG